MVLLGTLIPEQPTGPGGISCLALYQGGNVISFGWGSGWHGWFGRNRKETVELVHISPNSLQNVSGVFSSYA